MSLGIVAALADEAVCLQLPGAGDAGEAGIHATISGMGGQRAAAAAEALVKAGATALLSWGTAGALTSELSAGNLLLPIEICSDDGFLHRVDEGWHGRVAAALSATIPVCPEALYSSPQLVVNASYKQALHRSSGAWSVDMESAALARVAASHRIPFLCLRAVVDPSHRAVPRSAVAAVDEMGQTRPARLLLALLRYPGDLPGLIRLGREFGRATTTLRRVAAILRPDFRVQADPSAPL